MCTVILNVSEGAVRVLAVRDEDPERAWLPLGAWWPEHPGVVGVRDVRAGGAWLAADAPAGRLAVLLNRRGLPVPDGVERISRGTLPLASVAGSPIEPTSAIDGFNLVQVDRTGARVISWDGQTRRETPVPAGVHMIAHDDLDDARTARIMAWRSAFAAASAGDFPQAWLEVLARSGALDPTDDRAIVRDNRPLGYPTLSTLVCTAEVTADGVELGYAPLDEPGHWNRVTPAPPVGGAAAESRA